MSATEQVTIGNVVGGEAVPAVLPFLSEMPHGGFGQSGDGKDLSAHALEEDTRIKHVMLDLGE